MEHRRTILQGIRALSGFSTLEAVIALAIMLSTLSAVLLTVYGNQSLLIDGALVSTAREKAQLLLTEETARAALDFNLVNPITATTSDGYTISASVSLLPDYLTKRVASTASWHDALAHEHHVTFTTLLTNFTHAIGGDTCDSTPTGDWTEPAHTSYALSPGDLLPAVAVAGAVVSDVDAYHGTLAITTSATNAANSPSLFLFDITNQSVRPVFVSSIDNATSTKYGPVAVRLVGDVAYLADGHRAALQVVDVGTPRVPTIAADFAIPSTTPAFVTGSNVTGKSLAYEDGLLYLGLSKTATGPEFNIIDVHNPLSPQWMGGYGIGRSVNAITIQGDYAFLATDDNTTGGQAVAVLNVSDPTHPRRVATWSASGAGYAKSLTTVGNTLYVGRTYISGTQKELHVLDASRVADGLATLGSADIGTVAHRVGIYRLIVRDTLALLLTSDDIEFWNSGDPLHIGPTTASVPLPGGSAGTSLDCEGNYLYAGSASADTGYLTVLTAS